MDRIISSSRDRTSLLSTHKVLRNTYFPAQPDASIFGAHCDCQYRTDVALSGAYPDAGGYVWSDVPDL